MTDLFLELERLRQAGEDAALATIVATAGSTPGKEAMKLLVKADGTFVGTVGGGCLEAEVYESARQAIADRKPRILKFQLNERDYPDSGLLCGGVVTVLVEAVEEPASMLARMRELRDSGVPLVRISAIGELPPGEPRVRVLASNGTDLGGLRGPGADAVLKAAADEAIRSDRPSRARISLPGIGEMDVFVEPIAQPSIILFGGGHVSAAIARIAKLADFRVTIVDDRESFANRERHPDADAMICSDWEAAVRRFAPGHGARCVVITRGHHDDERVLLEMAHHRYNPAYLGMIGSRTKRQIVFERLRAAGVPEPFIATIRSPIGLDIGARTHAEIAVSLVAELIQLRRKVASDARD